ncbi:unnamed protein product [Rotaria sordida]|uniref:EDRF1 N-terminal domain-containing protein n=1 Tax=Rotaria sordida TaxID=392033 RepID=A0A819PV62_9BILA|nr:unnamed protein product [Rotaria sordida]CAF4020819.1 unnamed protein product [Rotaria sordida]
MKTLIGSDLPIFGDEQHPAVSLRLRAMNKPINVLTGPDVDIVTLYDLTSLCETDRDDNPYTLPVVTLLYKLAHNIVLNSDYETHMLDPEKFSEYYCAAAYMMADLFIDDNISELNWTCDENIILNSELSKDTLSLENEKEQTSDDID